MARPLRIELAGALYHVTARGDRREDIYLNDDDRLAWLKILGQVCSRFNWRCHTYCLMSNHYHLVIETLDGNLARGMRHLNGVYSQHFNRRNNRVGHVFQGRYKAIIVERDTYLLELARYVVLNPVRARMVNHVSNWPWSSYSAMTGEQPRPVWLETDWLLGQFSSHRLDAINAYKAFVLAGVGQDSIWNDLQQQAFLGGEQFVQRMIKQLPDGDLSEVPRLQRRGPVRPLAEFAGMGNRNYSMAQAYLSGHYTMKQIAEHFGVHYATVSRAIKIYEDK